MTADALAAILLSVVIPVASIAGGWAWKTQSTLTTLMTENTNDKEWRDELNRKLNRLESKIDDIRREQGPSNHPTQTE